ncbi:MAG TPA: FAD-dependent oxidoreductase [Xanthobacteraceae bacterium]|nr:FAD-dependent oxidoreductase [Xanthobacteraceae bacterium]
MPNGKDIPILIAGGGPVGLALAGDLGWRGIECLLVEQSDGAILQPRMDLVGIRTMEFCRRWGLVEAVEAAPYPRDLPQDNVYVTSLAGYELGRERMPTLAAATPPPVSPQRRERCPQNLFDPILRDFAAAQPGVALRYGARLVGFMQDGDGVTAEVESMTGGARERIRAAYLVGCDGGRSLVRETLGIGMVGTAALTYTTNVIFRCAGLVGLHDKGRVYRFIIIGPEGTWSTIVAINGTDQWRFSIIGGSAQRDYTTEEIRALIRRAVGRDFDYEILTVMPWVRRELVADRYGEGRVLMAGDAVHMLSPTGAFGMNTGIQDAVDLAWKLAAVLQGWGGARLLASYDAERRPVGHRNVREAAANFRRMTSPRPGPLLLEPTPQGDTFREQLGAAFTEVMRHEWYTLGVHLGYRYADSPICWSDGTQAPPDAPNTYVQSASPGSRAPHVWLAPGRSTLDLFGKGFALLGFGADPADVEAVLTAARSRGVPVSFTAIDHTEAAALYECKLALVRPDGHVAWRGDHAPDDPLAVIDRIRGAARVS